MRIADANTDANSDGYTQLHAWLGLLVRTSRVLECASVGVYFPANGKFYAMGGRSADTAGSDFTHPFEYDPATNSLDYQGSYLR